MRVRMILQAFPTDLPASFDDAMIKRENQKMCRFEKPQGSDRDEGDHQSLPDRVDCLGSGMEVSGQQTGSDRGANQI
jgi:hypothetical protein